MSQEMSRAVVERRAPKDVEADDPLRKLYRKLDFFPTPPWAARAGAELLDIVEHIAAARGLEGARTQPRSTRGLVALEPACGEGHMALPLMEYFNAVGASDIHDYGKGFGVRDFLLAPDLPVSPDWVITNPPFAQAEAFLAQGLRIARRGVALLCRASFLESEDRFPLLYTGAYPLTVFAPFSERVSMQLGSWDPDLSGATFYAWFIFFKHGHFAHRAFETMPIKPGTKARLSRAEDVRRFARLASAPLFDNESLHVDSDSDSCVVARPTG